MLEGVRKALCARILGKGMFVSWNMGRFSGVGARGWEDVLMVKGSLGKFIP